MTINWKKLDYSHYFNDETPMCQQFYLKKNKNLKKCIENLTPTPFGNHDDEL